MTEERSKDFFKMPTFAEMKAMEQLWKEDLFAGINQQEINYEGYPAKCPVRYTDQSAIAGIFLAKSWKLKRHMPANPDLRPAQILPGIVPLVIVITNNRATDIGPYNSALVITVIRNPGHLGYFSPLNLVPGFEYLRQVLFGRRTHAFVWRIADDSYISYKLGNQFFGMPKFQCDVHWEDEGDHLRCSAVDDEGPIFVLRAKKIKTVSMSNPLWFFARAYFYRDKLAMTEETVVQAKSLGLSLRADDLKLELGSNHPMAEELRDVLISRRPVAYTYMPESNFVIYEPGRWAPDVLAEMVDLRIGQKGNGG